MEKHLFRKFFGLIVLYIIIIFGIFAIQFRKELSIFQDFYSLNLRLSSNASEDGDSLPILSNTFRVSGNGLEIYASESNPILLLSENGNTLPLVLQDWEEVNESTFSLFFSNDVSLTFLSEEVGFSVISSTPSPTDSLVIPFEAGSVFNITDVQRNRIIVKSKEEAFSLLAGDVTTNSLTLSESTSSVAQISAFEETQAFTFSSVIGMENATVEAFSAVQTQARNHITRSFQSSQADSINEKFVAAYVAELASQGRYGEAIANVPASFINGNHRTYFTAPYFNTLVAMNQTLLMENENILFSMQYSLERSLLDVYELDNFPSFLLQQNTDDIVPILSLPSTLEMFVPTTQQATGIIATYITLSKNIPASAMLLEPVIEDCINVLQNATTIDGNILNITNDEGTIDRVFTAKAGATLREYGRLTSRLDVEAGGTMLIVSSLQEAASISASTLSRMYPYFVFDNPYYPHADVLAYNDGNPVWIWNIIPDKTYTESADGTIVMQFDFPVTEIYHSIITGIEPFDGIEIYELDYATDARFETYNAPGYVYQESTKTLLLRYRQRNEIEAMRMFYTAPQATTESIGEEASAEVVAPAE